jgi:hypothetical protein
MLEYIFFNEKTYKLFEEVARSSGINVHLHSKDEQFIARLPENSDDAVIEKLEDYYDELMDLDRELLEKQESETEEIHAAGIAIQLKNGRYVYARVEPDLLARIMQYISTDDLNTLVCAITDAVENPDEGSLCQRKQEVTD